MSGIIILEGPDGTGKTTLAQRLVRSHDAVYIHHGYHGTADWGVRHLASLRGAARLAATGRLVVIDRLWMSGDVYGTIYRDRSDVGRRRSRMLHRIALTHAAVTVLCMPENAQDAIKDHSLLNERRPEMYSDISKVVRFYAEIRDGGRRWKRATCYADLLTGRDRSWLKTCVSYDWRREQSRFKYFIRDLTLKARDLRGSQYQAARSQPNGVNVAGHLALASYLMVGEALAPDTGLLRYPFVKFVEMSKGCSGWFADQLTKDKVLEDHLLWTNATIARASEWHLSDLLSLRPDLRVVALGRVAERAVQRLGVLPVLTLNHPQYQKRFHYHELDYLTALKRDLEKGRM